MIVDHMRLGTMSEHHV